MSVAKADMYGSYLAVFSFAIAMAIVPLFFDSKVGSVLWALVAWQIYRRDKPALIVTLRLLFWFIVIGAIVSMVWLLLGPPNVNLRQFVEAEGLGLAISAGVLWWMHSFFEKSPTAADIFGARTAAAQAPASAGAAPVENPAPKPNATIAGVKAPATTDIAIVESPGPTPPVQNIVTRVFGRAKRVMSWRRRPRQPAPAGNSPAASSDVADRGGVTHTVARASAGIDLNSSAIQVAPLVATEAVVAAPPPSAVPRQVAAAPEIRAELSVPPKTVAPESHGTPPPTIIDDERIYAEVARELETGGIDKGLWTRLYAECDGDEKRTKVLYIRQRAERLIAAERARRPK